MKNTIFLVIAIITASSFTNYSATPAEDALKTFNLVFSNTGIVVWSKTSKSPQANFESGNIKYSVFFDDKGNLLQTIRYYYEESLPANIRFKLNREYEGKLIWGVTEVSNVNTIQYYIILRDDKRFYKIFSNNNGDLTTLSKFKRADILQP